MVREVVFPSFICLLLACFIAGPTCVYAQDGPWLANDRSRGRLAASPSSESSLVAEELELPLTVDELEKDAKPLEQNFQQRLKRIGQFLLRLGEEIAVEHLLRVDLTDIQGCYYSSEAELRSLLNPTDKLRPYFWQVLENQPRLLLKGHPWIRDAQLQWRIFPLRLAVVVEEFEPWLVADYREQSWLVSREGTLIEPLESLSNPDLIIEASKLPRLHGLAIAKSSFSSMKGANARLNYALQYLQLLKATGGLPFVVERYTLLPQGGMRVSPQELFQYPDVLLNFDSFDEARLSVQKLHVVLRDLKERGENPSEIDLRFNRQVIVRE